jgi:beta-glucosidase
VRPEKSDCGKLRPVTPPARFGSLSVIIVAALAGAACKSSGGAAPAGAGGAGGSAAADGGDGVDIDGGGVGGMGGGGTGGAGGLVVSGPFPTQACLDRADALVAMMTLDEKLAQTLQLERAQVTPAQVMQYGIGSIYSQGGSAPANNSPAGWADMVDAYQQAARASRLQIPIIYGIDVVHGVGPVKGAVVFPHNVGLGASRDVALVTQVARATVAESNGCGLSFPFSPVIAVARDERWGRTYEAFGETPELVSMMGAAMVQGLAFTETGAPTGIVPGAKHYLGDGGTAMGKTGADTAGDETALRAIHLTPYQAAVSSHVGAIMVSYSSWQGTKMHINKPMVTDVLKGDLGFGGFIASDFNGCYQLGLSNHDGLGACLNAGVDTFMLYDFTPAAPTILTSTLATLRAVVMDGTVPQARIDDAVRRIVAVKCEMGLFEASGLVDRTLTAAVGAGAHRALARQAVRESLVVLKNDGNVLPLAKTAAGVALAGNSADNTGNQSGGWTITWQGLTGNTVPGATSVRAALAGVIGADHVAYSVDGSNVQGATVGVAVIGETPYAEGMGDRTDLTIPAAQAAVVAALKQAGLPTVVVLIAGRPMILDPILPYADAIVMAWLPGSEGAGITDVLFGDAHPTGKLPHSWPRSMDQIPINQGDAVYDPLYPYGFGLTY